MARNESLRLGLEQVLEVGARILFGYVRHDHRVPAGRVTGLTSRHDGRIQEESGTRDRRGRRHRFGHRPALRARGLRRVRHAAQRGQVAAARGRDPCGGRGGPWLRVGRAQGRAGRRAGRAHRIADRPDRGVRVQHRRQRPLQRARGNLPQVLQGLGDGLLRRIPDQPGRGEAHGCPSARHDSLHGSHGGAAGQRELCGVCHRQARPAGTGAEHGARTRAH